MTTHPSEKIHVDWLDNRHVAVYMQFTPGWTWDDFFPAQDAANVLIQQGGDFVDVIYHFTEKQPLPKGYYVQLLRLAKSYPTKLGIVIWVGCHPVVLEMIRNVSRHHHELAWCYAFMDDLDEARLVVGP